MQRKGIGVSKRSLTDKAQRAQRARNNKSRRAAKIPPHLATLMLVSGGKVGARLVPAPAAPPPRQRLIEGGSEYRKGFPICTGFIDYFPDAVAMVSNVSFVGNMKHNPGEPMHHARGKSMDHADCIARHLQERGGYDTVIVDGVEYRIRHTAALAWRAMAMLQQEIEDDLKLPLPRAAKN